MAEDVTKGKGAESDSRWPNGEPQSVRDAYDKMIKGKC
jgi:hypothetical protein